MQARSSSEDRLGAPAAPLAALTAPEFLAVMVAFRQALAAHQETINRLNVYPVPDGDTGTNMLATVEGVLAEISSTAEVGDPSDLLDATGTVRSLSMPALCQAIAQGSLMGARGNSGVILCQILRGLAETAKPLPEFGATDFAAGLVNAAEIARAAVLRPVEGTILTVVAGAAASARSAALEGADLSAVVEAARTGAIEALWSTPRLLSVLADAGVVDAGGAGLLCLFDALNLVVRGIALPELLELPESVARAVHDGRAVVDPVAHLETDAGGGADELQYEVMYFLEAPDPTIPAFKEVWAGIGDSIVVVGGDGLWNCHIHTNDIGAAIEAALDVGRPRQIRVSDLIEQVAEEAWVREADESGRGGGEPTAGAQPLTSVVAVATGEGIQRIFRSLGVRHVVAGGQSMNPSTKELLAVLEEVPGEEIVILPNNTNIYPVAKQAAELVGKPCVVVATPGVQEGFAALLGYDPQSSASENGEAMEGSAAVVVAGEVTQAVRSSETPIGRVEPGNWIGLSRSGIRSCADSLGAATIGLLEDLLAPSHEIVTLFEGVGATEAAVREITEWFAAKHPGVAVERHDGGQPLYPFLVSIE